MVCFKISKIIINTNKYKFHYDNGYKIIKINNIWIREHRYIWEKYWGCKIPKGYEIHHIDNNKLNNHPYNLCCLYINKHRSLHNNLNPPNLGKKMSNKIKKQISNTLKKRKYKKEWKEKCKQSVQQSYNNGRKGYWLNKKNPKHSKRMKGKNLGEKNSNSKLTNNEKKLLVLIRKNTNLTIKEIANIFNIHERTVFTIQKDKRWRIKNGK